MAPDTQKKQKADSKQKTESKPIVENKAETESTKKSGKLWILIGSIALVLIVGGAAFWAYPHFKVGQNPAAMQKRACPKTSIGTGQGNIGAGAIPGQSGRYGRKPIR